MRSFPIPFGRDFSGALKLRSRVSKLERFANAFQTEISEEVSCGAKICSSGSDARQFHDRSSFNSDGIRRSTVPSIEEMRLLFKYNSRNVGVTTPAGTCSVKVGSHVYVRRANLPDLGFSYQGAPLYQSEWCS